MGHTVSIKKEREVCPMSSFSPLPKIYPLPTPFWLRTLRAGFLLLCGGTLYYFIEVLWRGYSHFSMFLCGGLCFSGLYLINLLYYRLPCIIRWCLGAILITMVEFICGMAVNVWLGWDVWDYSGLPLNVLGQVCLPFTLIWFFLCIPADVLCALIRRMFRIERPKAY